MPDTQQIVDERAGNYGHPKRNFERTARMWNSYLQAKYGHQYETALISTEDVPQMMILLKQARLMNGYHEDSVTDQEGYAKTHHMLFDPEPKDMAWGTNTVGEEGAN